MTPKVSVIVIYHNSEKYFDRCLNSLFKQTLDSLEYIFVDDGSTDNSLKILKENLSKFNINNSDVKTITFKENRGIAYSRKVGMKAATGKYIIHCDSDDYIDCNMYKNMYEIAEKNNSDIVCSDFFYDYGGKLKHKISYPFESPSECLKNWFNVKCDYTPLWNKLIKNELIKTNNIYPFKNINWGEDIGVVMRCFYHATNISFINKPYYYYYQNVLSISHSGKKELCHKSFLTLIKYIENYFKSDKSLDSTINNFKFNIKINDRFLYDDKKKWYNLFKECHKDILKFKGNSFKVRLIWRIALSSWYIYNPLSKVFKILR